MKTPTSDAESASSTQQASYLLALTGVVDLVAVITQPEREIRLLCVALVAFLLAGLVYALPANKAHSTTTFGIAAAVFVSLGISGWAAGDGALITGPVYLLAFVWLGLHQSVRTVLLSVPPVLVLYVIALQAAGMSPQVVGSAFALVPIAGLTGTVIAQNADRLRKARAQLQADERWRAAIMATLAHDVRSPLTSIIGALEVLADDPTTSVPQRSLLAAANRQALRIMRLATGLLEVERVDQGKLRLDTYEIHLRDLVQEIVEGLPRMDIELDVGPDLLVCADRERLEQIIVNLFVNAARHGAGPVIVSAESGPAYVDISLRDHGPGVPAGNVEHLFERLGATSGSSQSVGLGLWIVRLLAEAHDGSVRYEYANPGARFIVRLPNPHPTPLVSSEPRIPMAHL